jgi:crotonobetainyl-CoA:carnitine CoA-transferase CaiB-like acyl-CoA transferase
VSLPLEGLLVVEVGMSVAGPYAGQVLADLGARVIKVERPGTGDDTRQWGPPFWQGESTQFQALNRNKESIVLDLKSPPGREALLRLADRADVLIQNYRPGVLERLGFGYEALSARNPRLIYCAINAFGTTGPLKDLPGYDPLMQAYSGIMRANGEEGRPPIRVSNSLVDQGTAMWCVIGILSALHSRARTGVGAKVDASLYETALGWLPFHIQGYFATGSNPKLYGSGMGFLVPYQAFATADGYLMVAAGNDGLWRKLCEALERPDLADDARFASNPLRVRNRQELEAVLNAVFATRSTGEWELRIREAGVPCARVQQVGDALADPQTAALGIVQKVAHPAIPDFRVVGLPLLLDGCRPEPRRAPPALGADTEKVLRELGF